MSDYSQKVVWGEGMLLTPQHMQQEERYLEDLVHRRVRAVSAFDWGLLLLKIDPDALAGGELALLEGAGVFPDGGHFAFPHRDPGPAARAIEPAYPAGASSVGAYLALPRARPGEVACRMDPASEALTPFDAATVTVRDVSDGATERELRVARKRLRILFTSEPREAFSCLPIAVVRRTATGGFEFDEQFIPPCAYAGASPRLMGLLRRVLEVLVKKGEELARQRRNRGDGVMDLSGSESAGFWFLHTINQSLPRLRALFQTPRVHPFAVYQELAGLAGGLCTFSAEGSPADIPPFAPDDLASSFAPLEVMLLGLLGTVLVSRSVPIPLTRTREMVHTAQINDARLLSGAKWFLGVRTDSPPEKVIAELPIKAKISSSDQVDGLIVRALPGMRLAHVESPPGDVAVKAGRVYFQLAQAGEHWEAVRASSTLAIYVPAEFDGLELELVAVKD